MFAKKNTLPSACALVLPKIFKSTLAWGDGGTEGSGAQSKNFACPAMKFYCLHVRFFLFRSLCSMYGIFHCRGAETLKSPSPTDKGFTYSGPFPLCPRARYCIYMKNTVLQYLTAFERRRAILRWGCHYTSRS